MQHGSIFMIRLCSDHGAYEAVPKRKLRIDLSKLKNVFESDGDCEIVLWTPQLMVVKRRDSVEITFVDDGRMIIRNVPNQDAARRIAETILPQRTMVSF